MSAEIPIPQEPEKSKTRNGPIRDFFAKYSDSIGQGIHEKAPKLTPNMITVGGFVGLTIGTYMAYTAETKGMQAAAATTMTIFKIFDWVDGAVARAIEEEQKRNGTYVETPPDAPGFWNHGQKVDVTFDREAEAVMALVRVASAVKRGDKLGAGLAVASGISNPLPSVARATSETTPPGRAVHENGKNILELAGTNVGRGVLNTLATAYPEIGGVPVQNLCDGLVLLANLATTRRRLKTAHDPDYVQKEEAKIHAKYPDDGQHEPGYFEKKIQSEIAKIGLSEKDLIAARARLKLLKKVAVGVAITELAGAYVAKKVINRTVYEKKAA